MCGGETLVFTRKSIAYLALVAVWLVAPTSVHSQSGIPARFVGSEAGENPQVVQSYRSLRYSGVVWQTTWYTCGPAAVATLLTAYYNISTDESEMLVLAWEAMARVGADPELGITMWALKEALMAKGVESQGYRVSLDQLVDYFVRGGLPIIMHVTRPQPHYVVGAGLAEGYLVIADPAFGNYLLAPSDFVVAKGFEGHILVPLPDASAAETVRTNQLTTLERARLRLWQLTQLREGWM